MSNENSGLGGSAEPVAPSDQWIGPRKCPTCGAPAEVLSPNLRIWRYKAPLARAPQGDPPEFRRVLLPEPSSEAIQAALYAAQDTKSASDVEHVGVMLRAAYAIDAAPAPQGDAAPPDDPELDATDFAHPAWWRGEQAGVFGAVMALNRVLDEAERGETNNGVFQQPLQGLAERVRKLVCGSVPSSGSAPSTAAIRAAFEKMFGREYEDGTGDDLGDITAALEAAYRVDRGGASSSGSAPPTFADNRGIVGALADVQAAGSCPPAPSLTDALSALPDLWEARGLAFRMSDEDGDVYEYLRTCARELRAALRGVDRGSPRPA